jgi:hypothetical protein
MQDIRALDNVSFTDWFKSHGGSDASIKRMWDPIGEAGAGRRLGRLGGSGERWLFAAGAQHRSVFSFVEPRCLSSIH